MLSIEHANWLKIVIHTNFHERYIGPSQEGGFHQNEFGAHDQGAKHLAFIFKKEYRHIVIFLDSLDSLESCI